MDPSRLGWTYAVAVGVTLVVGAASLDSAPVLPRLLIVAVGVLGLVAAGIHVRRADGPGPRAAWAVPALVHAHVLWLGLALWSRPRPAPDMVHGCARTAFLPHVVEGAYLDYLTESRFAVVILALLAGGILSCWPRTRSAGLWTVGGVAAFLPLHWMGNFLGGCPQI